MEKTRYLPVLVMQTLYWAIGTESCQRCGNNIATRFCVLMHHLNCCCVAEQLGDLPQPDKCVSASVTWSVQSCTGAQCVCIQDMTVWFGETVQSNNECRRGLLMWMSWHAQGFSVLQRRPRKAIWPGKASPTVMLCSCWMTMLLVSLAKLRTTTLSTCKLLLQCISMAQGLHCMHHCILAQHHLLDPPWHLVG